MKIQKIVAHPISYELDTEFWMSREPYRTASSIIVQVFTDDGIVGLGQIHGRPMKEIIEIIGLIEGMIAGMDAMANEAVWQKVFALTTSRAGTELDKDKGQPHFGAGKRPQILAALAGIDIALWDIKGKALNIPVWRLLGGESNQTYAYASGGYYEKGQSPLKVIDEMASYVEMGYTAVKMKCGGTDLKGDIERISGVRKAIGPGTKLMIDANLGYSLDEATRAIEAFEEFDIFWFEEPLYWYDSIRALGKLANRTRVAIAGGESQMTAWEARDLVDLGGIRYMQFDATRFGGLTELIRVAHYCAAHDIQFVPHHDPQIHGHVVCAFSNGFGVETFPNKKRDPLWDTLFSVRPEIKDSTLHLNDRPGLGFEVDWKEAKKHAA
ncbi:L-alanine-DL-glutamate epimerase [Pollutimonas bauzanensis]|uniref:L-alanine-DL-glutamate epimerase n=2 Tax=Pollutimonas bauzanensis TaxID=658167 RepID=A0A1M5ZT45_9BURK|nr:L-alanine-DL-glutamate epimerase [Pollutimonas bauzanensis]